MKLKLKQYFCKHDLRVIAEHQFTQQNLWKCDKCEVFCIQHYGIGIHYYSRIPHLEHWEYYKNNS